jgi:hypothetical protein
MLSIIIFIITRGWHNRPGVAAVPIVSQPKKKKKKKKAAFVSLLFKERLQIESLNITIFILRVVKVVFISCLFILSSRVNYGRYTL